MDLDDLEMQRDVAFKIMYFFIAFVAATFGLLYVYFKMNQKAEEDALREEQRRQGISLKEGDAKNI